MAIWSTGWPLQHTASNVTMCPLSSYMTEFYPLTRHLAGVLVGRSTIAITSLVRRRIAGDEARRWQNSRPSTHGRLISAREDWSEGQVTRERRR